MTKPVGALFQHNLHICLTPPQNPHQIDLFRFRLSPLLPLSSLIPLFAVFLLLHRSTSRKSPPGPPSAITKDFTFSKMALTQHQKKLELQACATDQSPLHSQSGDAAKIQDLLLQNSAAYCDDPLPGHRLGHFTSFLCKSFENILTRPAENFNHAFLLPCKRHGT